MKSGSLGGLKGSYSSRANKSSLGGIGQIWLLRVSASQTALASLSRAQLPRMGS